jgi:hypothetical protein
MQAQKKTRKRIAALKARFPSRNPNKRAAAETTVSRDLASHVADNVCKRNPKSAARWIRAAILPAIPKQSDWHNAFAHLARNLFALGDESTTYRDLSSPIFNLKGNKKLKFATWSTLPAITCPGAGACLGWCYSFRAWRYPQAFCRQLLNTVLIRHRRDIISQAFQSIPRGLVLRLYVDGDFESADQIDFWMRLVESRQDLQVYGYSKSWAQFIDHGGPFPDNYHLNLSSGSIHGDLRDPMQALLHRDGSPLVRGDFVAVPVKGDFPRDESRYDSPEYHRAVRDSALAILGERVFSCPGKCYACTKSGDHACGSSKFQGITIAIGVH